MFLFTSHKLQYKKHTNVKIFMHTLSTCDLFNVYPVSDCKALLCFTKQHYSKYTASTTFYLLTYFLQNGFVHNHKQSIA